MSERREATAIVSVHCTTSWIVIRRKRTLTPCHDVERAARMARRNFLLEHFSPESLHMSTDCSFDRENATALQRKSRQAEVSSFVYDISSYCKYFFCGSHSNGSVIEIFSFLNIFLLIVTTKKLSFINVSIIYCLILTNFRFKFHL